MKRMLTIILKAVIILFTVSVLLVIWFEESRKFYCVNGNCITVWKRIGGTCYIISGKYYGVIKPTSKSYIQTLNWETLALYFTKKLPKQIIVVDKEYSNVYGKHFTISNTQNSKEFISYKDDYETLLFPSKELKGKAVTSDTDILSIDIKEGYVLSNTAITK
jgi:hypothetical protein